MYYNLVIAKFQYILVKSLLINLLRRQPRLITSGLGRSSDLRRLRRCQCGVPTESSGSVGTIQKGSPVINHGESSLFDRYYLSSAFCLFVPFHKIWPCTCYINNFHNLLPVWFYKFLVFNMFIDEPSSNHMSISI